MPAGSATAGVPVPMPLHARRRGTAGTRRMPHGRGVSRRVSSYCAHCRSGGRLAQDVRCMRCYWIGGAVPSFSASMRS